MAETVFTEYQIYLERLPLSRHTRRNYLLRVNGYLAWLSGSENAACALEDPIERNFSVNEYKMKLLHAGKSGATVNAVLSALDNFYLYLGVGPAKVKRQDLPAQAPRALEPEEQKRLMKAILRCSSARNRAIALTMLYCGLRISEVAALNVGDVVLTARKHELVVRCGKNSKRRVVPIHNEAAEALRQYLNMRKQTLADSPLFLSQKGNRISAQAIDYLIRELGKQAGLELSAHLLRHTCLTKLVRAGLDLVIVAEVAGHSRLETTRRYSLPTADVKIAAMEKLSYGTT